MMRQLAPSGCAALLAIAALGPPGLSQDAVQGEARLRPVAIDAVELGGVFWGPRLETHHAVTIPHTLDQLESHGHVTNFDKAAGVIEGPFRGNHAYDLYKGIEGAVYSLFHRDDPGLRARVDDVAVTVRQETDYPWDGAVTLTLTPERPVEFALCLRVPVWARGRPTAGDLYSYVDEAEAPPSVRLNGRSVAATVVSEDGYLHLTRLWQAGDTVELILPMPIRRVVADERVEACRGRTALMRGPLIYCLEAADHPDVDVLGLSSAALSDLRAEFRPDLLGGVTVLRGKSLDVRGGGVELKAVPYHTWGNRERGAMTVWIGRD